MAKSNLQYFQNDWNKTVNWATSNKIPKTSWYPVYQMDLQRYANGEYPMSQAERSRAILSASNLQANTVLPTDHPSPTNIFGNALSDLKNIFTGLEPTKLVQNIFDEFKNTLDHPDWLLNPEKNTLMQWLPGWADIGMYKRGGLSEVASHPIMSLLDVLPIANKGLQLTAHTPVGGAIAEAAGVTTDELGTAVRKGGQGSVLRIARRLVSNIPTSRSATHFDMTPAELTDALKTGKPLTRHITVGDRMKQAARSMGLDKQSADAMAAAITQNLHSTRQSITLLKPFLDSASALTADAQRQLSDLIQKSGRSYTDLINDSAIPVDIRQAITHYQAIENWSTEIALSSGRQAMIRLPDGTEDMYANTPSNPVVKARDAAETANDRLTKASAATDALSADLARSDSESQTYLTHLFTLRSSLYDSLRSVGDPNELDPAKIGPLFNVERANAFQVQAVKDILAPDGLIQKLQTAMGSQDFETFKLISKQLFDKFKLKNFENIGTDLATLRQLSSDIYDYAKFRSAKTKLYTDAFHRDVYPAYKASQKALGDFKDAVLRNPADRWRPVFLDLFISNLLKHDRSNEIFDSMANQLREHATPSDQVMTARSNPRVLYELVDQMAEASGTDIMASVMDRSEVEEVRNAAFEEIQRLRAQGFTPHYVPNVAAHQVGDVANYNVSISTTRLPTVDAAHGRLLDFTDSVYDVMAGASHGVKQQLARDGSIEYMDSFVQQHLYAVADLEQMYRQERNIVGTADLGSRRADLNHFLQNELGLKKFDPEAMFGISTAKLARGGFYIPVHLADALEKIINRDLTVDKSLFGKGTQIFRTAVLGYSPRFIAHIVFGGSFLVALRSSPMVFRFLPDAYRMVKEGTNDVLRSHATQQGADPVELQIASGFKAGGTKVVSAADKNVHWWGGVKMRNLVLREMMDKLNLDPSQMSSWLKVLPAFTFKFTNFVTNMQRSVVYLDGAAAAERRGWIIDESGHRVTVTPARAHEEGMRAAERVMGDLRHMTPLERHSFTKIMPFYGWTKHILRYVSSYPSDHPYRAMFLSNLANMNSEDVPSGLPTRLQLLFFLGNPSPDGSVTALDVRALNPLRDVANYATIGGFLSSLNPAFTAPVAMVDPSIVFGDNVLYPNLQYNQLYGVKEAAPSGNLLTAAEQYVPELTALDTALGISSQYRNLRKTDPKAYAETIFESLGLPFTPQHINIKQMAATNEIDRYQQAAQQAQNAWQSGDFSSIAGYPTVPDPLQPDYNITPLALEALYRNALAATGQPPSEVVPSLPAPNI